MSTAEKHTPDAEVARLQARIDELEAELKSKTHSSAKNRTQTHKLLNDMADKAGDEASRLLHALAQVAVEELRATADVVKAVSDEAFKRRDARAGESADQVRLGDVEEDVAAVLNKGIEKAVAAPKRVIDKFHDVYNEHPAA
jgi:hypothetical protein